MVTHPPAVDGAWTVERMLCRLITGDLPPALYGRRVEVVPILADLIGHVVFGRTMVPSLRRFLRELAAGGEPRAVEAEDAAPLAPPPVPPEAEDLVAAVRRLVALDHGLVLNFRLLETDRAVRTLVLLDAGYPTFPLAVLDGRHTNVRWSGRVHYRDGTLAVAESDSERIAALAGRPRATALDLLRTLTGERSDVPVLIEPRLAGLARACGLSHVRSVTEVVPSPTTDAGGRGAAALAASLVEAPDPAWGRRLAGGCIFRFGA